MTWYSTLFQDNASLNTIQLISSDDDDDDSALLEERQIIEELKVEQLTRAKLVEQNEALLRQWDEALIYVEQV